MKKGATTFVFLLMMAPGYAQDLSYEIYAASDRSVKKEQLTSARKLSDFIDGYPSSWIQHYDGVEILATYNGNKFKAVGSNEQLNAEQIQILNSIDIGADIEINVRYKNNNAVTNVADNRLLHVDLTITPEIEASFIGGDKLMKEYLKKNVIDKISVSPYTETPKAIVQFTINESGVPVDIKISKTSGNTDTDKLMIDAISKMPSWKPAENLKGVKVKQDFEFSLGNKGC